VTDEQPFALCAAAALAILIVVFATGCADSSDEAGLRAAWRYPVAERGAQVDDYHGVTVADPYRWLENTEAQATADWIAAQNELSFPHLQALPARAHFKARIAALIDYERFGIPESRGGRYVYTYNAGTEDQDSVWVTSNLAERGALLIDPATLSADGTASVSGQVLGPKGRLLAYGVSDGGSDWRVWRVRNIDTRIDLTDELRGIKFSSVSWVPDGSGFYYSRYPRSAAGRTTDGSPYDDQRQVSIWYHAIGTRQADDVEVYQVTDHPTRNPYGVVTDDGDYLVINLFDGYVANGFYYKTLAQPLGDDGRNSETVRLLDAWDARYEFLGNDGATFFFKTVLDAPQGRIIAIDLERPEPEHWRTVVAETDQAIRQVTLVGMSLIVDYMVDAHSTVRVFGLDGARRNDVSLPGKGSVTGFGGRIDAAETFFAYTDFTTPQSVFRYQIATGAVTPVSVPDTSIDAAAYVMRQVFAKSADGTRVPLFIVHRQGVVYDGSNPTVLYGYGGFNVSILPRYSSTRMAWLDAGGVFVSANLRGGGEYGETWYRSGALLDKQNVFDDFIAAAEWLIDNKVTSRDHLAIWGVSNGGLLAAATGLQRPDLFAAVLPSVGVLDMLRYHTASANARQWSTDYGLSENADEFAAQIAYSPYHNVQSGKCYPPTLVLADTNDDRVLPWHSYKFAAEMQYAQGCANPVLIRIETRSGHGAGRSTSKNVEQYADQWAFVAAHTGLVLPTE
jgi:prolyl oligopeptidase